MILRNWHYLLFVISLVSIAAALIAEYFYGLQPCELCLKQRHPYYLFVSTVILILLLPNQYKIFMHALVQIGAVYGIFYSFWHVGVENKFLKGPDGCSAGLKVSTNMLDLKDQILNNQ